MSQRVFFSLFEQPLDFSYNPDEPTFHTEFLSNSLSKFLWKIGSKGGYIDVGQESEGFSAQESAVNAWVTAFNDWLKNTTESVTSWLLEEEGGRALPALLAPPVLALSGGALQLLGRGIIVKMAVDVGSSIVHVANVAIANRRAARLERMFDKAFNRFSWFGLNNVPYLQEIADQLGLLPPKFQTTLNGSSWDVNIAEVLQRLAIVDKVDENGDSVPGGTSLPEIVAKIAELEKSVKIVLQLYQDNRGDITEWEVS